MAAHIMVRQCGQSTERLHTFYGLFTLLDTDSALKHDGYMVLYRNCSHCTDSDSDPYLDRDPRPLMNLIFGWISTPGSESKSIYDNVNKPLRPFNVEKCPIKADCINYCLGSHVASLLLSNVKKGLTVIHGITEDSESTPIVKSVTAIFMFQFFYVFSDRAVLIWNTKDFNSKERKYVACYTNHSNISASSSIRTCESIF